MKKALKITLKSDLCVGSGYSYAGIVDSDVCYDDCGLPYIPAKRLKGNLREAAELIGLTENERKRLFGEAGKNMFSQDGTYVHSGIRLGNAYIDNYKKLHNELSRMDADLKKQIAPQNVLEQFTVVKAQTKIMGSETAEDNSLRFTRVVKQYSPIQKKEELSFVAEIEYVNLNDTDEKNLEMAVKAMRNIGLNRNRGLGSVKCVLEDWSGDDKVKIDVGAVNDEEEDYVLSYCIRNTAPLVLNVANNYTTERYISGQSVLGYFASAYLKSGKAADETFAEIFLKNKVIFSGLYPCDEVRENESEPDIYYPAPSYINCMKKTEQYVNMANLYGKSETGNPPRRIKGKFICVRDASAKEISVKEVKSDIVYHHTKKSQKQDAADGELLYSFEVIREQQLFAGTITGNGKYIKVLAALLEENRLQFGKSKSSQYGTCVIEGTAKVSKKANVQKTYQKGSRILVTLQSDGIFLNDVGYATRCDEVREAVKKAVGIETSEEEQDLYSEIQIRQLVGYHGKWNLKRQAIPAVCAGSSFEFKLEGDLTVSDEKLYAGERIGEGYGKLAIIENNGNDWLIASVPGAKRQETKPDEAKELCKNILVQKMRERLRTEALRKEVFVPNPATLGRVILMLTESINANPDDAEKAYEAFCDKINKIAIKKKKDAIKEIKDSLICEMDTLDVQKLKYCQHIQKELDICKDYLGEAMEQEIKSMWSDYFMSVLTYEKYKQKGRIISDEKDKEVSSN